MENKLAELARQLKVATGLEVAYGFWPKTQPLPYLCYRAPYSSNFAADGIVYHEGSEVKVYLYTKYRDFAKEKEIEQMFFRSGLYWEKSEEYLEPEECYEISYELGV